MGRRTAGVIVTLAPGLLVAPSAADPQQPEETSRIGILETSSPDIGRLRLWEAFYQQLREAGYVEGQNTAFEPRWAHGKSERLPELAAELVRLKVDVIVTAGTPAAMAAKRATTTIPIVMATGISVGTGLIESLAGPGGNITGLSDLALGSSGKRLELLREVLPKVAPLAVLWDQANPASPLAIREAQDAARSLGVPLQVFGVRGPSDFDDALSAMTRDGAGGFIVLPGAMFFAERRRLVDLALRHRLPTMFVRREYAEAGGLMAYGANLAEGLRRAATYVDKILKGAKPADLPVEQLTPFELVVNLKTAKALGLTIPQSVLVRADEVIR